MEIKQFALENLKTDDEARTIEGVASAFGNIDRQKDIVMPGAFTKTLKKRSAMLWHHKTDWPVGVWDSMQETDSGLDVKGTVLDTTLGNDAYKLVKGKAVTGMSIGYSVIKDEIDARKGVRKLVELDLHEVSLVTFPANDKARITRVKSLPETEREFEEFLREAGYSRDAAKVIVAKGYKALCNQREAGAEAEEKLASLIDRFTALVQPKQ